MGTSQSKNQQEDRFIEAIGSKVNNEISRRLLVQREVQMAVNVAKARDTLWFFGPAWATLTSGIIVTHALKRPVPHFLALPVCLGGLVLANMADTGYGNKLARLNREAEHILEYEGERFAPPRQPRDLQLDKPIFLDTQSSALGNVLHNNLLASQINFPTSERTRSQ